MIFLEFRTNEKGSVQLEGNTLISGTANWLGIQPIYVVGTLYMTTTMTVWPPLVQFYNATAQFICPVGSDLLLNSSNVVLSTPSTINATNVINSNLTTYQASINFLRLEVNKQFFFLCVYILGFLFTFWICVY